ncbi:ABC transporter permease [Marinimicrobium sp. C2-29]|uniref:ABC transporter permease n=1 Tax=Marinimicrobium sp. C2-29 TaxID=3139825 RepID=UPI003139986C
MARALPINRTLSLRTGAGLCLALLVGVPVLASLLPYLGQVVDLNSPAITGFLNSPGLVTALVYSLLLAFTAPLLACYTALAFGYYRPRRLLGWLSPFLSIPHLAFAVGVLFLFSPTGWLVRALHSLLGVFESPPASALLADRSWFTLFWVLLLKEIPFLLLMVQSALTQIPAERYLQAGQTLGHSRRASWWLLVVPELLTRLRLPMAAVVIYTLSVVDVPLLIGPNLPGVWAQQVFQWQQDFSAQAAHSAVVGSLLLLALALTLLWLNRQHERVYTGLLRWHRRTDLMTPRWLSRVGSALQSVARLWLPLMALISLGVLAALLVWSFAGSWFYPDLWPGAFSLSTWQSEWPFLLPLLGQTLRLALISASVGLVAALVCLEWQARRDRYWPQWILLLGLFVPQLPLVMGWQFGLSAFRLDPHWGWVLWAHCVFTFPYAYLMLSGDYRRFNRRWLLVGQSLGYSSLVCWFRLLLPILKQPVIYAWVIAFSVSVAQYLPTQLVGAGRVVTITTEAVNIGSGGDRRLLGFYALWQMLLPLALLLLAALIIWRRRPALNNNPSTDNGVA